MSAAQSADHAIVMHQYGPPTVLTYTDVSRQPLKPDEVRIRSMASALNHTDLEIRAGNWPVLKPSLSLTFRALKSSERSMKSATRCSTFTRAITSSP